MIPFPEKKYSVIYADPPWNYAAGGKTRNVERHYRTMKPEDIYSPSGSGYSRRRLSSVPVGHIPEPGRRPGNDPALGLSVQNSRLRLGEAKPKSAFLVLGSGKLDTRERGNLSSGHKRQTEARVSVSP